jgi:hypothetical protein
MGSFFIYTYELSMFAQTFLFEIPFSLLSFGNIICFISQCVCDYNLDVRANKGNVIVGF